MFDSRNSLSHQVSEEVRSHFPGRVYRTVIPRNVRLSEAPSHGLPVALYDPSSRGAQAYVELVTEIIESESAATQAAETLEGGESNGGS
jgi:chromosome partitioning protein